MSKFLTEHQYRLTLRFVQGYRFLDRCGEALVKLEEALHKDWIPTDASPKGGAMRNDTLGMLLVFNAEHVAIQQAEFMSFDKFRDQACTIVDVLRAIFQIERFVGPGAAIVFQHQFKDIETAEKALRKMELIIFPPKVLDALGGEPTATSFALVAQTAKEWHGVPVKPHHRLEARAIRQAATQPFDDRLLRRTGMLPERQQQALLALQRLREMHPKRDSVAIELTFEKFFEGEIDKNELSVYDFLTEVYQWATTAATAVSPS